jgi:hypothetical protein
MTSLGVTGTRATVLPVPVAVGADSEDVHDQSPIMHRRKLDHALGVPQAVRRRKIVQMRAVWLWA